MPKKVKIIYCSILIVESQITLQINIISFKQKENALINNQNKPTNWFLLLQVYYYNFIAKINQK